MTSKISRTVSVLVATALVALATAAIAEAATSSDKPVKGGKIALTEKGGAMRKLKAKLPATCKVNNGQNFKRKLGVKLKGKLPLDNGRFRLDGDAPNGVEVHVKGKRAGNGFKGKIRLTYLDLDFVGPSDDSVLCDTGTVRYRTG